mgnify:CR=1 FL=1
MVPISLADLIDAAADLYGATGNARAADAATLMRAAVPERPADPPQALPVLSHLPSIAMWHELADLPWTDGGFSLPAAIKGRNAYAELVGPEGPVVSGRCRFGLYLQEPDCLYPPHSHAAEELYLLLDGSAEWQLDDCRPFTPPSPGLVHHQPWQKHAMRTGASPLLALWAWLGDIRYGTYTI